MGVIEAKRAAALKALDWIDDGMCVGLGTGSTVQFFIEELIKRCKEGLKITAVASSERTHKLAQEGGISLTYHFIDIDVCVDGADEIDSEKRMIKGGGGALFREKIVASASKKMIVIVDDQKKVEKLHKAKVPVEIFPLGHLAAVKKMGKPGEFRMDGDDFYMTDNGNYIFDISLQSELSDPESLHNELIRIPGVIETGLFFGLPVTLVVGYGDGKVEVS